MPTKIFVGNIAAGTKPTELEELFAEFGPVNECVIPGGGTYGFVHMKNESEADRAIKELNGTSVNGSALSIQKSIKNSQQSSGRSNGSSAGGGGRGTTKLFIGNLHAEVTDSELKTLFETYGKVVEAAVCKGYGFVHLSTESEAREAVRELDGYSLHGANITVEISIKNSQQGRREQNIRRPEMSGRGGPYRGGGGGGRDFPSRGGPAGFRRGGGDGGRSGRGYGDRSNYGPRGGGGGRDMKGGRDAGYGNGREMQSLRYEPYGSSNGSGRNQLMGLSFPSRAPVREPLPPPADYYAASLAAPPAPVVDRVAPAASATGGLTASDSFARDLLQLYTKNPEAFDRYAKDPLVRKSLNIDPVEPQPPAPLPGIASLGGNDPYYRGATSASIGGLTVTQLGGGSSQYSEPRMSQQVVMDNRYDTTSALSSASRSLGGNLGYGVSATQQPHTAAGYSRLAVPPPRGGGGLSNQLYSPYD